MGVRGQPTKWDRWYSKARWARIRKHQLLAHPLCKCCLERGIVTPAEICDHVEPHRGDVNKFWLGPFQSLCKECHNSTKRFVELHGFRPDIGLDGWPLDPRHPLYNAGGDTWIAPGRDDWTAAGARKKLSAGLAGFVSAWRAAFG